MAKAWRVIGTIVLIFLILGALSLGVGLLTGGSVNRIMESYFGSYEAYIFVKDNIMQYVNEILAWN